MDFRFNDDERQLIESAGAALRRGLTPERLLETESTASAWAAIGRDGWLEVGRTNADGSAVMPLHLLAGIGREAGKVLAGDGFVTNAVLLGATDDVLPPGFLLADGRTDVIHRDNDVLTTPWCFGVEPGLPAYRVGKDGRVWEAKDWTFEPIGELGLGVGAVSRSAADTSITKIALTDTVYRSTRITHAATLVGVGEAALHLAVEYAQQRIQFGVVIGAFQAVKHALADATVALEIAWNAVLHAAVRPDDESATIAQLQAKTAVDHATRTAVQTFGGIGMTWEHPMHLYLKVGQLSRRRFGSSESHALHLADNIVRSEALT